MINRFVFSESPQEIVAKRDRDNNPATSFFKTCPLKFYFVSHSFPKSLLWQGGFEDEIFVLELSLVSVCQ